MFKYLGHIVLPVPFFFLGASGVSVPPSLFDLLLLFCMRDDSINLHKLTLTEIRVETSSV